MLYQLVFRDSAAIWIKDESVIYLDTYFGIWFVDVPLRDIASVSVGPMGRSRRQGLIFALHDGSQKATRTLFLAETSEIVLSRLAAKLDGRVKPGH